MSFSYRPIVFACEHTVLQIYEPKSHQINKEDVDGIPSVFPMIPHGVDGPCPSCRRRSQEQDLLERTHACYQSLREHLPVKQHRDRSADDLSEEDCESWPQEPPSALSLYKLSGMYRKGSEEAEEAEGTEGAQEGAAAAAKPKLSERIRRIREEWDRYVRAQAEGNAGGNQDSGKESSGQQAEV